MREVLVWGGLALLLLLAGGVATLFYQTRPRHLVGTLLRLESVPTSIRDAECESWGLTDVLTTCYFQIDPAEFPALLNGWAFQEKNARGGIYSFSTGPKLGPDFPIAARFSVQNPTEFKNGGQVILVVNATRSKVQVNYYEE